MARADSQTYALIEDGTETGPTVSIRGGIYLVAFSGTLGTGGTIQLEVQMPHGEFGLMWIDSFNSVQVGPTDMPYATSPINLPACNVRAALNGGTPTGVFAYLTGIG